MKKGDIGLLIILGVGTALSLAMMAANSCDEYPAGGTPITKNAPYLATSQGDEVARYDQETNTLYLNPRRKKPLIVKGMRFGRVFYHGKLYFGEELKEYPNGWVVTDNSGDAFLAK